MEKIGLDYKEKIVEPKPEEEVKPEEKEIN
jgi:hypothetical protein